jgi:Holliday junction DNA helicase RuvA
MRNDELSRKLREHASRLARAHDNLYRVRAFRQAALVVSGMNEDVTTLIGRDGGKCLEDVPGIGKSLAKTIARFVEIEEKYGSPATVS